MIDLIDLFFNGDLDLFWHIVCFSTVLWVIIVEVSLSGCLSGQLHSHLIYCFITSLFLSFFYHRLLCRIGIASFGKQSNLTYMAIISFVCIAYIHLTLGKFNY